MELLILAHRKSANTLTFSLIIFVGISEIREIFLVSKRKNYFCNVFCSYFRKRKFIFAFMFGLNSKNTWLFFAFHYGYFCISQFEYRRILRLFTLFDKKMFNTSAVFIEF